MSNKNNMRTKIIGLLICGVMALAWTAIDWPRPLDFAANSTAQQMHQPPTSTTTTAGPHPLDAIKRQQTPPAAQLASHYRHFMAHRPPYLADVELPGSYGIDAQGNLLVDSDLKEMLDFFFLAVGDLSFEQIHDLIAGSMISTLQEPARSQALAFLDRYFSYIDSYDRWQQSFDKRDIITNDPAAMRQRLTELEDLRRQHLGDDAYDAFFANADKANLAYVDAQIALQQPNLTEAEKIDIRRHLNDSLPAEVRQAQQAAMTLVTLTQTTAQLQNQGASATEIFQARAAMVGEAAASRLAQVDDEERQWAQKRQQYRQLSHSAPGIEGMTAQAQQTYLADLAHTELGLSASEVQRMQALDRIDAGVE